MKTLTIKNPWATLIIEGHKQYEFRSWKTNYRGKILIHTSKKEDKEDIKRFESLNLKYINSAIIGEATLTDCILVDKEFDENLRKENPLVYGNEHYNKTYAWKLENIKKYDKPIFASGHLGLWNYEEKAYEDLKTPQELYYFMENNIKYGIHGTDGKDYDASDDEKFQNACNTVYALCDKDRILKYGLGHCWDQTELERDFFKNNNYEHKTLFICFMIEGENNYPTHAYLVYKKDDKWYLFEHSDYYNRGIKKFDSYEDAVRHQMNNHIKGAKDMGNEINEDVINSIRIYEYNIEKHGISTEEFIDNILENSNDITKKIIKKS